MAKYRSNLPETAPNATRIDRDTFGRSISQWVIDGALKHFAGRLTKETMLSHCHFGTMMFEQHDMRAWKEHRGLKYLSTEIEYDQVDHFVRDLCKRVRRRPGRSDGAKDPFAIAYIDCQGTSGAVRLPDEIVNLHLAFLIFIDPEDQEQAARHFAQIQERYDTKVNSTLVEEIEIKPFDEGRGSFANLVSYLAKFEWLSRGELAIETYRVYPNNYRPLGDYRPRSNMARASAGRSPVGRDHVRSLTLSRKLQRDQIGVRDAADDRGPTTWSSAVSGGPRSKL